MKPQTALLIGYLAHFGYLTTMQQTKNSLFSASRQNLQALTRMISKSFASNSLAPRATRFAPSPTGHLHLGHAAAALCVHGLGRAWGFTQVLRSEDHDRGRSRAQFETAILDELEWLGLSYENAASLRTRPSAFRQSDHLERYAQSIETLAERNLIYGCDCTRKRLSALSPVADPEIDGQQELVYDGFCRDRGLDWRLPDIGARLRLPAAEIEFFDGFLGEQSQKPSEQCGDVLLRDRHGNYTYQAAVTIDDMVDGIGLVVRGQDLLASTGRQILLARFLGRAVPPIYAHHPLLTDESGKKLGKRFFSASLSERRARGEEPQAVIGEALWRLGLLPRAEPTNIEAVEQLFKDLVQDV